jgi:uncharacterized damage-inducible protein DinB
MNKELIQRFESEWRFARGLTRDLLESLEPHELAFTPGANLGPFWKHFRHLGRVQENYLQAIETGRVAFGFDNTTYRGDASRQPLVDYLDRVDQRLTHALMTLDATQRIDWFGGSVDAYTHFTRMADHEILHHGIFVVYVRLLGRSFPRSWAAWGL